RLPWLRLYAEGEPVEDVFRIISANVRIPRMTLGDLGAQVAAGSGLEQLDRPAGVAGVGAKRQ
ncbi:MAG: hydantoinase B/oxoprolinase family protein, partial [Acidimicrobiia bacterium]|nr:hydantoinase B/oxoprolinase family protein [Acidimicrobiia bacterium]